MAGWPILEHAPLCASRLAPLKSNSIKSAVRFWRNSSSGSFDLELKLCLLHYDLDYVDGERPGNNSYSDFVFSLSDMSKCSRLKGFVLFIGWNTPDWRDARKHKWGKKFYDTQILKLSGELIKFSRACFARPKWEVTLSYSA